jgi:hypothetical protein
MTITDSSAPVDIAGFDPAAIHDHYARHHLDGLSDEALFELAAQVVSRPKKVAADSFRLHAPLELLARHALLGYVDPARRAEAREQIVWVAAAYARSEEPDDDDGGEDVGLAASRDAIVASLAAAAHTSIYLYLLPRVAPRSRAAIALARPLVRELRRFPDWKVEWTDREGLTGSGDAQGLTRALLETPRLGLPGSDFIYPIVHAVDANDVAKHLLGPVVGATTDLDAMARVLARVAAWSMLQDDSTYAPYGWTHCLTIPQAVAGIARTTKDPLRAMAIAATHVVGFRAALSDRAVIDTYAPEPFDGAVLEALDASPATAAAAVHHASGPDLDDVTTEIATRAALHRDAHVVKYTLACFDAAHADPQYRRLFLSAAAYLGAWWTQSR